MHAIPQRRRISRRHAYLVFGILQAGVTSAVAAGIACRLEVGSSVFWPHWAGSWLLAWMTMVPVVVFATPVLRRLVDRLTAVD